MDHGARSAGLTPESPAPRLYDDLAAWWPLLSPPTEYVDEAADLLPRLGIAAGSGSATLLELGAGGGSLAFHLKRHFRLTLTDRAPAMLAVSRELNPECEHLVGDIRSLRLGREFDVILIHDAIMYATDQAALRATLRTAAIHCRPGGTVAICWTTFGRRSLRRPITADTTPATGPSRWSTGCLHRHPKRQRVADGVSW